MRTFVTFLVAASFATLPLACSGNDSPPTNDPDHGPSSGGSTDGSGGAPPSGGSMNGGDMNGGGQDSTGGAVGIGAECETADDCTIFVDCCTCSAVPVDSNLAGCDLACIQDACSAQGIPQDSVACSAGRCVFDLSCDFREAFCSGKVPECQEGTVPSVLNGCFGPCIPPTECREVTACDTCGGDSVCVEMQMQVPSTHCVIPAPDCFAGNYCECLDACPISCAETDEQVGCFCVTC